MTIFTPLLEKTHVIKTYPRYKGSDIIPVDIGFALADLEAYMEGHTYRIDTPIPTKKNQYPYETMFFFQR